MKTELESQDIEAIAQRVLELLKPLVTRNGNQKADDTIFDIKGLSDYLKAPEGWIYERSRFKEIPHYKVGNRLRFRKSEIDKWLTAFNVPAVGIPKKAPKRAFK